MFTRTSSALVAICLLAACSEGQPQPGTERKQPTAAATDGLSIDCAEAGGSFARTCSAAVTADDHGRVLTVRQSDGGFRRFRLTQDGRGVVAADGAEPAHVRVAGGDAIEVTIGASRYRLPATIAAPGP